MSDIDTAKAIRRAKSFGDDFYDEIRNAFDGRGFTDPEHRMIGKAREAAKDSLAYLECARILLANQMEEKRCR